MKLNIKKATTDVSVYLFIQNSSLTTGAGLTGLVYNSASLVAYYVRPLASAAALTLATQTVTGAHSDGGFVEVDATNMPGMYRLDLSDAICATGVNSVVVMLKGATNMAPVLLEIQLVSYDPNDSAALGLTLVPANVTQISGDSTAADNLESYTDGTTPMPVNATQISGDATAADNAESFFDGTGYAGTNNVIPLVTTVTNLTNAATSGDLTAAMKASVNTEVDTAIADARLDELLNADSDIDGAAPPTVGSVFHELLSKTAGSFTFDQTTDSLEALRDRGDAAWITATGFSTLDAAGVRTAVGLASANLDTQLTAIDDFLDTEVAAIKAKTDNLPSDPADASDIATSFGTVNSTLATVAGYLDTEIAAIKAKTDNLPALPAATGDAMTLTSGERNAIADAHLDRTDGIETGVTPRQSQRVVLSSSAGKLSGAATTTVAIRNVGDTKDRITATVDASGNRTAVTLDAT